jgi:ferredoxin-like protein FixX
VTGIAIITEACIDVKDRACVDVCPVQCIYEFDAAKNILFSEETTLDPPSPSVALPHEPRSGVGWAVAEARPRQPVQRADQESFLA